MVLFALTRLAVHCMEASEGIGLVDGQVHEQERVAVAEVGGVRAMGVHAHWDLHPYAVESGIVVDAPLAQCSGHGGQDDVIDRDAGTGSVLDCSQVVERAPGERCLSAMADAAAEGSAAAGGPQF